ncbi:hypothetical protein ACNKHK_19495 [Shigella flexneri]
MMKPGMGSYNRLRSCWIPTLNRRVKNKYLIPYFISAHRVRERGMVNLALWLNNVVRLTRYRTFTHRRWRTPPPCSTPGKTYYENWL